MTPANPRTSSTLRFMNICHLRYVEGR